ncbi:hypothetical protein TELCIR_21173, partial [Teladorsagia circumcincta]
AMTVWLQVALAVVMFLTTAIAGFIPLKLLRFLDKRHGDNKKHGRWLSLLSCFSGGVFMGTCFLDIIPHIKSVQTSMPIDENWGGWMSH